VTHRSGRGVHYASNDFTGLLKDHGVRISMSRKGNPYDKAFCESFIKTLKYEEVHRQEYCDLADAHNSIERFIEKIYNGKRLHSALDYRPPVEFERSLAYTRFIRGDLMKKGLNTQLKNEGALKKRFLRHDGIYRSDVSLLFVNSGRSAAIRPGCGQAIGNADEFRPAIPQRVARQHCPSPLHRHHQNKTIAASSGSIYHRAVTGLVTVRLSSWGKPTQELPSFRPPRTASLPRQ
jgi:hypothetical protein